MAMLVPLRWHPHLRVCGQRDMADMTELPELISQTFVSLDDGCALQSLGLGGNSITDKGLEHLAKALWTNTTLECLGLGGNQIGA